ncbi:hypothetical protein HQ447_18005 [bacterium]|nr:hypothetical protein [bacterium]
MFLRANKRFKDGKEHRYWSVVENRCVAGGGPVQKTLLYRGEINDSDRAGWTRAIEAVDERDHTRQIHVFPADRPPAHRLAIFHLPAAGEPVTADTFRIEESFRTLKGDLGLRPVYHRLDARIEAHVFISFLAYCQPG